MQNAQTTIADHLLNLSHSRDVHFFRFFRYFLLLPPILMLRCDCVVLFERTHASFDPFDIETSEKCMRLLLGRTQRFRTRSARSHSDIAKS